ncbi:MAG: 4-hydroxy-tetrahydrodipicolinate reductase [Haliscomenobacteraceae bacterium CHB4]|nr:4-hydroxy-tetrahydrodipicolinate reductase [Saprospiraceae bacterium]MCE7925189.1 4-hydroxy-tetrahydrodipicolinate reductase [Haliscomenobacteraceae bacterium CHB4]
MSTLKIGLFGYGKMGRAIESLASEQGIAIAWRIAQENRADVTPEMLRQADVVIEFTRPEAAFENVILCLEAGVPVVSGTTGWLDKLPEAQEFCLKKRGALLWASNFSVGVNLFFALNTWLSKLMNGRPEYAPAVTEIHHIHKLDAPSGTALTLIHEIVAQVARTSGWALAPVPPKAGEIPVTAIREGEVPGTHIVRWENPTDEICIEHRAHSRAGFANGAILAAKWLAGKQGVYSMKDVLGLNDL